MTRRRGDYQLDLPLIGAAVPTGYRGFEFSLGEIYASTVLDNVPLSAQTVLPLEGMAEPVSFGSCSAPFVYTQLKPHWPAARASQEASALPSRVGPGQIQLGSDLLALPQEGA